MKPENYDVIVIGSGMGGLSAAALLAQGGYKTLVVERLPKVGGRFSTIEYKGFKLTTAALMVAPAGVKEIFDAVGVKFEVRSPSSASRFRIDGKDYELSEEEGLGGLTQLLFVASQDEKEVQKVMRPFERALLWQEPSDSISFRDWLLQYTQNHKIIRIFWAFCNTGVGPVGEVPAGEFFRFLKGPRWSGVGVPPEGNLAMMESLVKAIVAKGAQVWTGCPARQIVVADGMVRGVTIQKGGELIDVAAKAVISNTGPRKTVELAGRENFDRGYLKQLDETLKPLPEICIQIASDRPFVEYPLVFTNTRRLKVIHCLTLMAPELAPKGKHLIIAEGLPRSFSPPYDVKVETELNILDLRDNLPGFDEHAEILVATYFREDWPVYHTMPGRDLPQKTAIENLYNVGDGVKPPGLGGLNACAESARRVVEDIKLRFAPGKV